MENNPKQSKKAVRLIAISSLLANISLLSWLWLTDPSSQTNYEKPVNQDTPPPTIVTEEAPIIGASTMIFTEQPRSAMLTPGKEATITLSPRSSLVLSLTSSNQNFLSATGLRAYLSDKDMPASSSPLYLMAIGPNGDSISSSLLVIRGSHLLVSTKAAFAVTNKDVYQTLVEYEVATATAMALNIEKGMVGAQNFGNIIYQQVSDGCAQYGLPINISADCLIADGLPRWEIILHELGHSLIKAANLSFEGLTASGTAPVFEVDEVLANAAAAYAIEKLAAEKSLSSTTLASLSASLPRLAADGSLAPGTSNAATQAMFKLAADKNRNPYGWEALPRIFRFLKAAKHYPACTDDNRPLLAAAISAAASGEPQTDLLIAFDIAGQGDCYSRYLSKMKSEMK
jgi:hypothetical protein